MVQILKIKKQFYPHLLFLFASTFFFPGCSSMTEYIPEKIDSPLHQRILFLEKEEPEALIQFMGKTSSVLNDKMKSGLESTGITIETIVRDVFTASGNIKSIKKSTLLDFVVFLEMAQKLELK